MSFIPFTKTQGAGNDFLIIEGRPEQVLPSAEERRRICDRRFGVGADGIVFLSMPGRDPAVDADLRIFNCDGGEVEISGNGTRCAAAYLVAKKDLRALALQTCAGIKKLNLVSRDNSLFVFEMAMGKPILSPAQIPFHPATPVTEPIVGFPLPLNSGTKAATVTSMGNPHCSLRVDDFDWDWRNCGREIENHHFFPQRTNVEFYRPVSREAIEVRFWERGVGETLSSGTGSCAAAVAAVLNDVAEKRLTVLTQAGPLQVRWETEGIYLTGPAEILFEGKYFAGDSAQRAS